MPTSPPLPFLDADAIRASVPIEVLLDAVEGAYGDVAGGRDRSPVRSQVALEGGTLLLMPGLRAGGGGMTVKVVTVMPQNPERNLPTIHALVVWIDAESGRPVALLDGATLTAMRTGAASGVGARLLARPDARRLAVIGAGAQAEWQLRAVCAARPIERVLVAARDRGRTDAFARRMAEALGLPVEGTDVERAVRAADVVCCATTSFTPVFDSAWVRPGTHVSGIGAFRIGMVEMPPEIFARASVVAVDARDAAFEEAGDLVAAIDAGLLGRDDLIEIGAIDRGWAASRDPEAITVFKSVGLAIQDVAAAEAIVGRLLPT